MNPALLGLLAAAAVFLALAPDPPQRRASPLARLYNQLRGNEEVAQKPQQVPWVRRLPIMPLVSRLQPYLSARYRQKVERLLRISRLDRTYTYTDILGMKIFGTLVGLFYTLLLGVSGGDPLAALIASTLAGLAFVYPDSWLQGRARRRQDQVLRDLPAFLSALAVTLEAGLNLMAAIAEVVRDRKGALAEELRDAVDMHERGLPPSEALEAVTQRLEVSELTVVLSGLLQAFAKGSGQVVSTVRAQAAEAWEVRRRRAETLAQTASFKLFLPIALLALPGFLIFLLGPAVLEILGYFQDF